MLVLTRKIGESIRIGDDIIITVKQISGKHVRLGIQAPSAIPVYREEIYIQIVAAREEAAAAALSALPTTEPVGSNDEKPSS